MTSRFSVMTLVLAIGASAYVPSTTLLASETPAQLGPRPFYLVDELASGPLKDTLSQCARETREYSARDWSIGHRGAALQFPEHTLESYRAAARMGAGIIECDVTFTADGELVCRHAQCDLHTTTNILSSSLAEKCSVPFTPATFAKDGSLRSPATARCCASDLTLDEFKSLVGKMDASDPRATTVDAFLGGTAAFRTDLYATGAMLLSHRESIDAIRSLGGKFTPELKAVTDGFGQSGLDQSAYARKLIEEYRSAGIDPKDVWPQSFDIDDVLFWIREYPDFGRQAVLLDDRDAEELAASPPSVDEFVALKEAGLRIIAPPMPVLLSSGQGGAIVPSEYAVNAGNAGLELIAWTVERSGRVIADVQQGGGEFYFGSTLDSIDNDGDILTTIDVLAQQVGIIGLFSDWPATTTFYANCLDLP